MHCSFEPNKNKGRSTYEGCYTHTLKKRGFACDAPVLDEQNLFSQDIAHTLQKLLTTIFDLMSILKPHPDQRQPKTRAEGKTLYSFKQINCYAFFPYFRHMLHFDCKHIELALVKLVLFYDKLVKKLIHSHKSKLISK